jgi:hypothetical protein
LNQAPEQKLKKRKLLSFKEFTPIKKSKFIFLHVNIFRKRKNEEEEKKQIFSFLTSCFLENQRKII